MWRNSATIVGAFGFAGSCGLSSADEERLLGGNRFAVLYCWSEYQFGCKPSAISYRTFAADHMLSIDDVKEFPKYEKLWKEIFQIR
jgi:hypothetical protein